MEQRYETKPRIKDQTDINYELVSLHVHEKLNIYILIKKMGNLLLEFGYLCRDIQCL